MTFVPLTGISADAAPDPREVLAADVFSTDPLVTSAFLKPNGRK